VQRPADEPFDPLVADVLSANRSQTEMEMAGPEFGADILRGRHLRLTAEELREDVAIDALRSRILEDYIEKLTRAAWTSWPLPQALLPPGDAGEAILRPTPDDVTRAIEKLAEKLPQRQWRAIVAVVRGGLYPAQSLLQRPIDTESREIIEVEVRSYRGRERGEVEIVKPLADPEQGEGLLVIDDLIDSAGTLFALHAMLPRAHFATIYAKSRGLAAVREAGIWYTYADEKPDLWIEFPWERLRSRLREISNRA
jgi:xanthine phosphoribosyltransferase